MEKKNKIEILKGFTFQFAEEEHNIEVWGSSVSGKEKVFVNGKLVSECRSLKTDSNHNFTIGDNKYSVNFNTVNIYKGPLVCTLLKNGKVYKRQKLLYNKVKRFSKQYFINMIKLMILGVFYGILLGYLDLSKSYLYISFGVFILIVLSNSFSRQLKNFIIEDEEV